MKDKNKDMIKALGTGMVLGGIITGGGVYASTVGAGNVSYSNASSGLSATTAQGAIDALYTNSLYHEYYNDCHRARLVRNGYTVGIFSCTEVSKIASSNGKYWCETNVGSCCNKKCSSTTNTCYNKCFSGYDNSTASYFIS